MAFSASSAGTLLTRLLGKIPVIAAAASVVPEASIEALAPTTAPTAPGPTFNGNGLPSGSDPAAAHETAAASLLARAPWYHYQTSSSRPVASLCSPTPALEKQRQAAECCNYAWQFQMLFARSISSTGSRQCEQSQDQQQQQSLKDVLQQNRRQQQQEQPHRRKKKGQQQGQQQQKQDHKQHQQHGKQGLQQQQREGETSTSFQDRLARVKQYLEAHGCLPPTTYREPSLGWNPRQWLLHMRSKCEGGTLPPEMAAALDEALGDVWRLRQWRSFKGMLERLKFFQETRGRLPQQREVDGDGVKIGVWVNGKRNLCHAGRLPADRIAALEGVPGWTWKVNLTVDEWLDALWGFEQVNGRLPKARETWDGLHVAEWIHTQRKMYHKGMLSEKHIAACESLPGWVWKLRTKRSMKITFEAGHAALDQFIQAHGRLPKKRDVGDAPDKMHLGSWCSQLRVRKKQGKLTPDQVAALEQVPGWW